MPKIDRFLNLLGDGAWHNIRELARRSRIPKQKLETLSKLLSKTKVIEYKTQKDQVKINDEWQGIVKNTGKEEQLEKAAVGSIIIPPKKSVTIENIQVTNLTDVELEISMRVGEKLKELAINTVR